MGEAVFIAASSLAGACVGLIATEQHALGAVIGAVLGWLLAVAALHYAGVRPIGDHVWPNVDRDGKASAVPRDEDKTEGDR